MASIEPTTPVRKPATTHTMATAASKSCAISNLMSPPDPMLDSFQPDSTSKHPQSRTLPSLDTTLELHARPTVPAKLMHAPPPLSPPVSPFIKSTDTIDPVASVPQRDPILYPGTGSASSFSSPLFGSSVESNASVHDHIQSRSPSRFQSTSPPSREDYELAVYFTSTIMDHYNKDPRGWLHKQRELLKSDRRKRQEIRRHDQAARNTALPALLPAGREKPSASNMSNVLAPTRSSDRVRKPNAKLRAQQNPKSEQKSKGGPHHAMANCDMMDIDGPAASSTIPGQPLGSVVAQVQPQQISPVKTRPGADTKKAPRKRATVTPERTRRVAPSREDRDFQSLEDLCPPIETLAETTQVLKANWKSNPLDLSNDPHRHLLHPDEIQLASGLRLDCATYLTSKRRIFLERRQVLFRPKEFRKTDAQQTCNIDVNKASKLWEAFDKVGWFDIKYVMPYLSQADLQRIVGTGKARLDEEGRPVVMAS